MILAFDTYYYENKAKTVCLGFDGWNKEENYKIYSEIIENLEEYKSGEFYKRELPCILSLLEKIMLNEPIEVIIIDGYVYLDNNQKFGLGGYLYESLNRKIPIIGVAKTNFAPNKYNKVELLRGKSKNPLYITSIGIDIENAREHISKMSGDYRIPKLLKELDKLTKEKNYG